MNPISQIKAWFPPDQRLGHALRRGYRRLLPIDRQSWHPELLDGLAARARSARFVQVGSNDAGFGDPLRYHILHHGWRGLMIEPLPHIFARLRGRYADVADLQFANIAIDRIEGTRTFYHLRSSDEPGLPPWYDQLGSFLKENVLKHTSFLPDIPERIVETQVRCQSFAGICREHGIDTFDVLHIDAEGYDFEVLRTIDLTAFHPTLVLFEHRHLRADDYRAALLQLHTAGFLTHADPVDTVAVSNLELSQNSPLRRAWSGLRRRCDVPADALHSPGAAR